MSSIILAIETSCDETAAAVVEDGVKVLANIIASQDIHRRYGGVVPEIASRRHLENIGPVVQEALDQARISPAGVDAIAATYGPGLVGSLLVGLSYAKGLAFALKKPFIGVHHLVGHIYAGFLEYPELPLPAVCLVASGGHTSLFYLVSHEERYLLGSTRDDAAGEAFDKVARALGLGYPGGPELEKLARNGDPQAIHFPRAWLEEDSLDFSFSGLKTAVANYLRQRKEAGLEINLSDVAASFQEAVVDVLVGKTLKAALKNMAKSILAVGGVASNRYFRFSLKRSAREAGIPVFIPHPVYCTDNAAMIGCAAYYQYLRGQFSSLDLDAAPGLPLEVL
ncbi:MAG: tRNA (adenosine(37)-N6)-threonylcarbamoyltransferase complex transferase subunit TsaD [Thermanaeromonas sp.]|uniref:tRNA (adenosine(37)-N6)-threonylcarbamoyltransferase complex transferase subunit TsaD n=1 Tax=Thermanaeromonas sp. TaxID=2003697 RepID=UPI00243B2303|nr:tRNA (adenosine(37)-N6)-threonylcarbamoyltransferase complex transferase subunit TsaD [Thermanaeromonas sp.]MCG0278763.1 tRNA (adenosine(37)-N6)-threonylcarbamoyltransferase complex transferase subunit TsaD [Thermanaeromonas sp.]